MPSIPSTSAPFAGLGRLRAGGSEPMSSINVTPLVDVMLVLLVIFIITAPLLARSIRLDLPESAAAAPGDVPAAVHVAVNREGQVFLDSRPITLEALGQALQTAAKASKDTEVQLAADRSVPYGRAVEVLGLAQQAGLQRTGFVADTPPGAPAPSTAEKAPTAPQSPPAMPAPVEVPK